MGIDKKNKKTSEISKHDHAMHRERHRQRYLNDGPGSFQDHELLELLLYYNVVQKDTNALAHRILNSFGGMVNLMNASPKEISNRCHLSIKTGILISLLLEFQKRYTQNEQEYKTNLSSVKSVVKYIAPFFIGRMHEVFYVICLDSQNRLINSVQFNEGSTNSTHFDIQQLVRIVLGNYASTVILAHNHPSGDTTPTLADITSTEKVYKTFEMMRVSLADHIIISGNKYYSFAENSMLSDIE